MRLLLIAGVVVALVFIAVMLIAPGGAPLDLDAQRGVADDFESNGPPDWLKTLGNLVPAPSVAIEPPPEICPDGTTHFAAAGEGYRVLHMTLKSGGAGLVIVSLLDPRQDHESGPYRICLGGPDLIGCSNERIGQKASVPVGPRGACIALLVRSPPAQIVFD